MKYILLSIIALSLAACASSTGSKGKKEAQKYTNTVKAKGLSKMSRHIAKKCPTSKRSWKGMSWRQQLALANACIKAKKWSKVDEIGNHMAQSEHVSPWGSYYMSVAALSQRNFERARWMIDLAIKKAPQMGLLHYQKGRIHWSLAEYDKGIAAFKLALKKDSQLVDAHHFLGQVYFRDQNFKKSIRHFSKVIEVSSGDGVALIGLAESYARLGSAEKAVDFFNRAINQNPRHLGIRLKLAEVYENQQKDYESALQTYKRIKELKKQRRLRGSLTMNLDDKIKSLEAALGQNTPGKKLSRRNPASR